MRSAKECWVKWLKLQQAANEAVHMISLAQASDGRARVSVLLRRPEPAEAQDLIAVMAEEVCQPSAMLLRLEVSRICDATSVTASGSSRPRTGFPTSGQASLATIAAVPLFVWCVCPPAASTETTLFSSPSQPPWDDSLVSGVLSCSLSKRGGVVSAGPLSPSRCTTTTKRARQPPPSIGFGQVLYPSRPCCLDLDVVQDKDWQAGSWVHGPRKKNPPASSHHVYHVPTTIAKPPDIESGLSISPLRLACQCCKQHTVVMICVALCPTNAPFCADSARSITGDPHPRRHLHLTLKPVKLFS